MPRKLWQQLSLKVTYWQALAVSPSQREALAAGASVLRHHLKRSKEFPVRGD